MRFVSTPEVLERFVSVEREIVQIDNELSSAAATEDEGMAAAITISVKCLFGMTYRLAISAYFNPKSCFQSVFLLFGLILVELEVLELQKCEDFKLKFSPILCSQD